MINRRVLARATAVGTLAAGLAATAAMTASAQAAPRAHDHMMKISASVSDSTPASGQEFVVTGKVTVNGIALPGDPVKVESLRNGTWSPITGAVVSTRRDGTYRVRVILSSTGNRTLRVVGDGVDFLNDAKKKFTVTVH